MSDGRVAKIKSMSSGMPEWPFEVEATGGEERSFTVRYDGTQEYHPHTMSPIDLMSRLGPCKSKIKKG